MALKIQYCSDLHLEFAENKKFIKQNPITPVGDIFLLAGDIILFNQIDKHKDFFKYISDNFKQTYWIPGNHEYYHFDAATKSGIINEKITSNVSLVNNIAVQHENVNLIFTTLWSKISPENEWLIERRMNDFHVIKYDDHRLSSQQFNLFHAQSMEFLLSAIQQNASASSIVVTHHVPTLLNYPEVYRGSDLNEAFAVELFDLIEKSNINYWIYGHHHFNTADFTIGNTRLLTNQLGYIHAGEHELFQQDKIIHIPQTL